MSETNESFHADLLSEEEREGLSFDSDGFVSTFPEALNLLCFWGDYNQRIPRLSQPVAVAEAMSAAIPGSFMVATAGMDDREGVALVDHIACSSGLSASIMEIIPKVSVDGLRLSDHPGIVATLSAT